MGESTRRSRQKLAVAVLVALSGAGCSDEDETLPVTGTSISDGGLDADAEPIPTCLVGEVDNPAGGCCTAGTRPQVDGTCLPAGIPPELCGEGFVANGAMGCDPVLPAESCLAGLMAIPGESSCRQVAPCGQGDFGDIPVEANTQHVDTSYLGTDSDGSAARPWSTIAAGVAAAESGAIVAVAAGSYVEHVTIQGKAIRLWGRCPNRVEVVGPLGALAAVDIRTGASGTEVRSIAIRGATTGLALSGSQTVIIDRIWIHDTSSHGLTVQRDLGPTSASLSGSLVEKARQQAVLVIGSEVDVSGSVLRDTRTIGGTYGRGIGIQAAGAGKRSTVTMSRSVLSDNHEFGVYVSGSSLTMESSVIRDTLPQDEGERGRGISVHDTDDGSERGSVTVRTSVIERNHDVAIFFIDSDGSIETSSIRDTLPNNDGKPAGIAVQSSVGGSANVLIQSSVVERSHHKGIYVLGADITIEGTIIKDNGNQAGGWGLLAMLGPGAAPPTVTVRESSFEGNYIDGIAASGATMTIEQTLISNTLAAQDGTMGRGVHVQDDLNTAGQYTIRHSILANNNEVGLMNAGTEVHLTGVAIRDTRANTEGHFGDGIVVGPSEQGAGSLSATDVLLANNARAGINNVASTVAFETTSFECNQYDLNGVDTFSFDDRGGNTCGCAEVQQPCTIESLSLLPPVPGDNEP